MNLNDVKIELIPQETIREKQLKALEAARGMRERGEVQHFNLSDIKNNNEIQFYTPPPNAN